MVNSNQVPESKLINVIVGLLIQADTNLCIAERFAFIQEPPPYSRSPEYEFLRFTANNWFLESITLLHTILFWYSKPGKEEFVLPDDGNEDLNKIKTVPFIKIVRNHATAHKSIKLEQPSGALHNKTNDLHIKETRNIIEELKKYLFKKYKYSCKSTTGEIIIDWLKSIINSSNLTSKS